MKLPSSSTTVGFLLGMGAASSCRVVESFPDHCANQDGDEYCARKYPGGEKRFCSLGTCSPYNADGCEAERPATDACYSACGEDKSLVDDPDCEGIAEASSSESGTVSSTVSATEPTTTDATTEPTGTTQSTNSMTSSETDPSSTTDAGCTDDDECADPLLPFCIATVCVPCSDAAATADTRCAEKDELLPVCGADGACVQCTPENPSACTDVTPVCDGPSSACVACTYHEQCEDSACRIATGECFDVGEVYDVGQGQTYETIDEAVTALGEGVQVVLRLHAGPSFDEGITLAGMDTAYAFIGVDDPAPQWVRTSGMGPTLAVNADAEAYVEGVRFTANTFAGAAAVEADGASVWMDRAELVQNAGGGIALTTGAFTQLRNCFVGGATDLSSANIDGSTADFLYTSIVGGAGDATTLSCDGAATVTARNSALVGRGGDAFDIVCDADITFSVTEDAYPGMGNVTVGDLTSGNQDTWFESFAGGDFSLNAPPAAWLSAAQWNTGDPSTDIDGEARAQVDGAMEPAGADLP